MKLLTKPDARYDHVLAAKNMRIELKAKFPGIKFSVRSKSFSMGDSVDVKWIDGPTTKEVDEIIGKYQHGYFNGMEDIYESNYTGFHEKHGSTKYASSSRGLSYDCTVQVLALIGEKWGVSLEDMDIRREAHYSGKYDKAEYNYNLQVENAQEWLSTLVHREGFKVSFYNQPKTTAPVMIEGVSVTENEDKNGVEVRFPGKPGREVLDELKSHGFRWHRKLKFWYAKRTPERVDFANSLAGMEIKPGPPAIKAQPKKTGPDPRIKKFRTMAENMQKHIDAKRAPMTQNPTPRRMRQYNSRIHDADNIEKTQQALKAIALALESGSLPDLLNDLRSKADIAPLVRTGYESQGYYDFHGTGQYVDDSPKARALQGLIDGALSDDQRKEAESREAEREIEQLEEKVRFSNIPGFFPTPKPVIGTMVERARVQAGDEVYDPEAGKGDIADFIKENFPGAGVAVGEVNHTLRQILKAKGHDLISSDFMEYNNGRRFDKIIMNPPFENGQDMEHIRHAHKFLNEDGCLVSVISEGPFFRQDKKASGFREWLDEVGGYTEQLDPKSFTGKDAFRQTGVSTRLVIIEN